MAALPTWLEARAWDGDVFRQPDQIMLPLFVLPAMPLPEGRWASPSMPPAFRDTDALAGHSRLKIRPCLTTCQPSAVRSCGVRVARPKLMRACRCCSPPQHRSRFRRRFFLGEVIFFVCVGVGPWDLFRLGLFRIRNCFLSWGVAVGSIAL